MSTNAKYEPGLKTIRFAKRLPYMIAAVGLLILLPVMMTDFMHPILYVFNLIPIAFIISITWYFNLKCPKCGKRFVKLLSLNANRLVNPKSCQSCGLKLYQEDE